MNRNKVVRTFGWLVTLITGSVTSAAEPATTPPPVVFTTEQDHRNMLEQLGITRLRPGRSPRADAPNAANYDEARANPYPDLPELLRSADGTAIATPELWWLKRRPEILELLEREVYGRIPTNVPAVQWQIVETREIDVDGTPAIERDLVGVVDNSACPEIEVRISLSLTLPKKADTPVPVLLSFGFTPRDWERFGERSGRTNPPPRGPGRREKVVRAGWGYAVLNPLSVQDDTGGWEPRRSGTPTGTNAAPDGAGLTRGIIGLVNRGQPRQPDQWGALRAWAWGASRALDYLETVPEVDSRRVCITGVSRFGKAALVAMAFDQRFAAGLIASSGRGGTALFRRNFGESLENLAWPGAYHWMAGNFLKYAAEESRFGRRTPDDLPVDSHMTLALCAPRLVFISHGIPEKGDAPWIDHRGSFMAAVAAQKVWRLLGARDLGRSDDPSREPMPAVLEGLLHGAIAWRQHDGGHTDEPNLELFIQWAENQWREAAARTDASDRQPDLRSLKAAVADRYKIGVGVDLDVLQNPEDVALIRRHFQILTPENCMKPQALHPAENVWRFEQADAFANFARSHGLELVGHCLVWAKDDRTDRWMMEEPDGRPVTRETLLRRIETHVRTVVERYADVVTMWDVVNEAVADGGDDILRDSIYSRTAGVDFIVTAFRAARAADPDALLIYNDYNCHMPHKRRKLLALLRELKERGAPVDAYGMQGHLELGDNSLPQLRETFEELRKLGLKVVVSELDLDVVTRSRWWAEGGRYRAELARWDPYRHGLPPEVEQNALKQWIETFSLFEQYRDMIARISFWNLHDGQSWLNYFPWPRTNYPLLWDRQRRPKPAFDAVYRLLLGPPPPHEAVPRTDPVSQQAHQQLVAKTRQGRIDVYFAGDSIVRRWGATDHPHLLEHWRRCFHGWHAANFGWGGDTTHNILWRIRNGEFEGLSPKIIVLQAGANNLPWQGPANETHIRDVVDGIRALVGEFHQRAPAAVIVLTAMFPRSQNPDLQPAIEEINRRLALLADGKRVRWVNINPELVDAFGRLRPEMSRDGLHLELPAYEIWARALRPIFEEVLGPPASEDLAPPPTGNPAAAGSS